MNHKSSYSKGGSTTTNDNNHNHTDTTTTTTTTTTTGTLKNGSTVTKSHDSKRKDHTSQQQQQLSGHAVFYLFLLTLQCGLQPMLTRHFTSPHICKSSVIMVQEFVKFFLAMGMLFISGEFKTAIKGWTIKSWIQVAAIPAGLYSIQNIAALKAYQNLDGVTFIVLNQTKTLSAAVCCYLIMGRKQSFMQITSLFLLLLSALVMEQIVSIDYLLSKITTMLTTSNTSMPSVTDTTTSTNIHDDNVQTDIFSSKHFTHGVIPVLLASFISGLSGAISQKNLQSASGCGKSGGRNAYLFSSELCIASIILLSVSLFITKDGLIIQQNGFFDQWTFYTIIPILSSAMGGIVVGLVTKYAGSVRKGFALIFGIFLTGLVQTFMDQVPVTKEQLFGGILAAVSLWMHASYPSKSTKYSSTIITSTSDLPGLFRRSRKHQKEE